MDDASCPRLTHIDDYPRYGRQMILDNFGLQGFYLLSFNVNVFRPSRPNQAATRIGSCRWCRGPGMSCTPVPRCRRCWQVFPLSHHCFMSQPKSGRIAIIDHDTVELSNIQRQVLHNEETIGMPKVLSATVAIKK